MPVEFRLLAVLERRFTRAEKFLDKTLSTKIWHQKIQAIGYETTPKQLERKTDGLVVAGRHSGASQREPTSSMLNR
jgi:hypothetical protein